MELLSVSEYAEMSKISVQAVYKRLKGDLKENVYKVGGKTFIDVSEFNFPKPDSERVISKVEPIPEESSNSKDLEELLREKDSLIAGLNASLSGKQELIDSLKTQIAYLQDQTAHQQQQIDKLSLLLEQEQRLNMPTQIVPVQQYKPSFWKRLFHRA